MTNKSSKKASTNHKKHKSCKNKSLKQTNKKHSNKKKSKTTTIQPKAQIGKTKTSRLNIIRQVRRNKIQANSMRKRSKSTIATRSRINSSMTDVIFNEQQALPLVALVSMHASANLDSISELLTSNSIQVLSSQRDIHQVLDLCKVADVVILSFGPVGKVDVEASFDQVGYETLSAIKAQGLPNLIGCIHGLATITNDKQRSETFKTICRYFHSETSNKNKIFNLDTENCEAIRRYILNTTPIVPTWRQDRGYMLSDLIEEQGDILNIYGYSRGLGINNCEHYVHLTGLGDYKIDKILDAESGEVLASSSFVIDEEKPTRDGALTTIKKNKPSTSNDDYMSENSFTIDEDEEWVKDVDHSFVKPPVALTSRCREDLEFPDEVDTPNDQPARERFKRYSGINKMDYEAIPQEYSKIYQLDGDYSVTSKIMRRQAHKITSSTVGRRICIQIKCALQHAKEAIIVSTLLPHERKVSLMYLQVQRSVDHPNEEIASKEEVDLHVGFKHIKAKPVYCERDVKSGQYRYLRDLNNINSCFMSIYASINFVPSTPVLTFALNSNRMILYGSVHSIDTRTVMLKRIILTGYPVKVNKNNAVVRYMFFNSEDVKFYKSIELCSKKGLRGHITDSLGTHGYMKCKFNKTVKQGDTICLQLVKRVFPKWFPATWEGVV